MDLFDTFMYCSKIITAAIANTSIMSQTYSFFVVRIFKI